jgi:uncharacterized caspase-like protein
MRGFAVFVMMVVAFVAMPAMAIEPRIALVVGNTAYDGEPLERLPNATKDARLISDVLRQAGFEVIELSDAGRNQMLIALKTFRRRLEEAGPGAVGLFYFAGHGLQSYGTNYLLAIDAPVEKPADIPRHGFEADDVLRVMLRGGADTNILILDACRPNHVATILRPVARAGLREIDARGVDPERSVMIAYSTGLGENAADGDGDNGPYAKALADNILVPDLPLEAVFRRVRAQMVKSGSQKPWESNAMLRSFAFVGEAQ